MDTPLAFVNPVCIGKHNCLWTPPICTHFEPSKVRHGYRSIVSAAVDGASAPSKMANVFESVPAQFRSALLRLPEDAEIPNVGERHTKIVGTVGPSTYDPDNLLRLIAGGVNLVRLNLCHGDYEWHSSVIENIRDINLNTSFVAGVMIDLGSFDSVRLGEFARNPKLEVGDSFTLTVRHEAEYPPGVSEVSLDGFIDLVEKGDMIQCQAERGGIVELLVKEIAGLDVACEVVNPGELRSRGTINIRGKSLNLTPRTENEDLNTSIARAVLGCPPDQLEFAISERVEYVALSFVESADQVLAVRNLLRNRRANIGVIAKIESPIALRNLESITDAADGIMVARGDLGTAIQFEKVPYWQQQIADVCRRYGKPCMVSTHFLESMVLYPTPTRAEVTDMTEAAKQRVDALVLTAETASGKFPFKALSTMNSVLLRIQERIHELEQTADDSVAEIPPLVKDTTWWTPGVGDVAENIANSAAVLANQQNAAAILVFTQKGLMATLMSRYRPRAPIYAFTATPVVRNKMNLLYGVRPFRIPFEDDPEETIQNAMNALKERQVVKDGDLVVILADVLGGREKATEAELLSAFSEISKGNRFITASETRNALRILGLKLSDKLEAQLGMRDVDIAEVGRETRIKNEEPTESLATDIGGRYDFQRFHEFASQAKEIVHTLQLRNIK
ncbi:pyruvate kinase [Gracilaria domingensis]|nr:pyruvate kinase [Gracilaria domingensis]